MASSIQLLRSTIPQERPLSGNLLEGQPAANLHSSEPGLFFKTTDGSVVKFGPAAITSDGSPPNSAPQGSSGNSVGELWLDKSVSPAVLKVYDGTQWVDAGSGGGGGGVGLFVRWSYSAIGGETSLSGSSGGVTLEYTPGLEEVFLNGVLLTRGSDYSALNGSSITNLAPLANGDIVTVLSMIPAATVTLPGAATISRWIKTADDGATSLSGLDNAGQELVYEPGLEQVFVNGVLFTRNVDYLTPSDILINGLQPLSSGDVVTVLGFSPFNVGEQIDGSLLVDGSVTNDKISPSGIESSKLSFKSSQTSSVTRSVRSKLEDTASILDFGPKANGVDDDAAVLQAAVLSGISKLVIPNGTILGISNVSLPDNFKLQLDGKLIKIPSGGPLLTLGNSCSVFGQGEIDMVNENQNAILSSSKTGNVIEGLYIHDTQRFGIEFIGGGDFRVTKCKMLNLQRGVEVFFCDRGIIEQNFISNTVHGIQWWGGDGVPVDPGTRINDLTINGNIVKNCSGAGIWGSCGRRITVTANTVESCEDICIDFECCNESVMSGNTVADGHNAGLTLFTGCKDCVISGNAVRVNSASGNRIGIWLTAHDNKRNTITGNSVIVATASGGYAAYQDVGSEENIWTGNTFSSISAGAHKYVWIRRAKRTTVSNNYFSDVGLSNQGGINNVFSNNTFARINSPQPVNQNSPVLQLYWADAIWNGQRNTANYNTFYDWTAYAIVDDAWGDNSSFNDVSFNRTDSDIWHRGVAPAWKGRMTGNYKVSDPNNACTIQNY